MNNTTAKTQEVNKKVSQPTTRPAAYTQAWYEMIIDWAIESDEDYERWLDLDQCKAEGKYRSVCYMLTRRLKSLPEFAGLSSYRARKLFEHCLDELGLDYDDVLSVNAVSQLEQADDFESAWNGTQLPKYSHGSDPVTVAFERAKANPLPKLEVEHLLERKCSDNFLLFVSLVFYLQDSVGPNGYILIPQERIAELVGVHQPQISAWCNRLKGRFLEELEPHIPTKRCTKWRFDMSLEWAGTL